MPYLPTYKNYLTVANATTNNGQKNVRIVLDVTTNILYSLDDDGNFIQIGSGTGGAALIAGTALDNTLYLTNSDGSIITINDVQTNVYTLTSVTLSSADILSCGTNPVQILPAPGPNKYYDIESVIFELNFNTTPYNLTDNYVMLYDGFEAYAQKQVLTASQDTVFVLRGENVAIDTGQFITYSKVRQINKPIGFSTIGGANPTGGDSTLTVKLRYKINTFGI